MQSIALLLNSLRKEYPQFHFTDGAEFRWDPSSQTIFYKKSDDVASLLHELSHAILNHRSYIKDIELIEMERDAWHFTTTFLLGKYGMVIEEDAAEDALDTYREWLHARSTCPECSATGIQTRQNTYKCLACSTIWTVNDARICHLRRYVLNKKHTS